ncbi:MAG: hypothetical protein ABIN95_11140 [Mucilaginibacter sp.]
MAFHLKSLYCSIKESNYIFFLFVFCAACTGPGKPTLYKTVKLNAQNYLIKHLNHASHYEPVSFSGLDSIVQSYRNNKIYLQFDDSVTEVEAVRFREMGENFKLFKQREESGFYDSRQAYFKRKRDSVAGVIEPEFVGYKIEHQFKAADSTGVRILKKYVFCFDEDGNLLSVLK